MCVCDAALETAKKTSEELDWLLSMGLMWATDLKPSLHICVTSLPSSAGTTQLEELPPAPALSMDTRPMHTYSIGSPRCPGVKHAGNLFRFVCEERHNHAKRPRTNVIPAVVIGILITRRGANRYGAVQY